jgi:hypothetical protein
MSTIITAAAIALALLLGTAAPLTDPGGSGGTPPPITGNGPPG